MEKLDKEAVAKEQLGSGYKDYELVKTSYIAGLEYAENHYLKIIEEKDYKINTQKFVIDESLQRNYDSMKLQAEIFSKTRKKLEEELQQLKQEHVKSCDDFGEFREKLQHELQTAKELLKEAYEAMGRISYKHKQFFSKQKIEEFLKQ